jgi:hypothetical protein
MGEYERAGFETPVVLAPHTLYARADALDIHGNILSSTDVIDMTTGTLTMGIRLPKG